MTKFKTRLIYDATTGTIRDDRKWMTMLEDFWFAKRPDGTGTSVTTLPPGQNLGKMEDVEYFEKKLFQSLNVPISRLQDGGGAFNIGRTSEISRDELKFQKFILRLRNKFSGLFLDALEKQLVLKGVIADNEWENIKNKIHFIYQVDNYTAELKDAEIFTNRVNTLAVVDPYVGRYYSEEWVQKNILMMTDEDIEQMQAQIQAEMQKNIERQKQQQDLAAAAGLLPDSDQQGADGGNPPLPGQQNPQEPQVS
jgi:hypothetical protein